MNIYTLLQKNTKTRTLQSTLQKISSHKELLEALGQYIVFNAPFGAHAAKLAGLIGTMPHLFSTKVRNGLVLDCSNTVASYIFAAAIDEFGGIDAKYYPHRKFAQSCIVSCLDYYNVPERNAEKYLIPTITTTDILSKISQGYSVFENDEKSVFRALGFHLAAEDLAGDEFRDWDTFLNKNFPELVQHLTSKPNEVAPDLKPYAWIKIHTVVEDDHAELAKKALQIAYESYTGTLKKSELVALVQEGYDNFSSLQSQFLKSLVK